MKTGELFYSKYLNAMDVGPEPVTVEIELIEVMDVGGDGVEKDFKPVVHFKEVGKALILNKTNCEIIEEIHGDETDNWIGKKVQLRQEKVMFQGKRVSALRVVPKLQTGNKQTGPLGQA